jgi:hypothetical protein
MANSFDSALVIDAVASQAQTVLANRLAPFRIFSSDYTTDVKKAGEVIQVPIVSATNATLTNPTNFEPGFTTTVGKTTVTLDHVYQPFGISNADLANGHRLERLIRINLDALADKLFALAITPITTANFGNAVVTTTTITPGSGHLATLWSAVAKSPRKGLVLSSDIYSRLIPTNADFLPLENGAYGFDQGVYHVSSFSGAVSGLDGFACSPDAIAIASAQPVLEPGVAQLFAVNESVTLDQLGMTVYYNVWGSTMSRSLNASIEVMFGSSAALTSGTMGLII